MLLSMLLVIEGIDGCGKGTQADLLCKKLDCKLFKYPTTKFSMLNDYLEKKVNLDPRSLFLLFLSDIMNEQEQVAEALDSHEFVILDRYVFSTIAYEKQGIEFEQGEKIIDTLGFMKPDNVILLDIPAEVSQDRKQKQKQLDRYEEDISYLRIVRENFLRLKKERFLTPNWHKVDSTRDVQDIHNDILDILGR